MILDINGTHIRMTAAPTQLVQQFVQQHTRVELITDQSHLCRLYTEWNAHKHQLLECVQQHNIICEHLNISRDWIFSEQSTVTIEYAEYCHELWAHLTLLSTHTANTDHARTYARLSEYAQQHNTPHFSHINTLVHRVEHYAQHLRLQLTATQPLVTHYTVQHTDTAFSPGGLSLAYHDVGRPQYEKWKLSGTVHSAEISNYTNISDRIELQTLQQEVLPDPLYTQACISAGVPQWGHYVPLAQFQDWETQAGAVILDALLPHNNRIHIYSGDNPP